MGVIAFTMLLLASKKFLGVIEIFRSKLVVNLHQLVVVEEQLDLADSRLEDR